MLLLEYLIFNWTYQFGADKNLTDHVSFAGTIVGIILAVVAIIYSFVQAESQNRSSASIASQISSLRDVVRAFDDSKSQFSVELNRIDSIATKLDSVSSGIETSHKKIDTLREAVHRQLGYSQKKFSPASPVSTVFPVDTVKKLLNQTTYEADSFSCALQRYLEATGSNQFAVAEFVPAYFLAAWKVADPQRSSERLIAMAQQILASLRALGAIDYKSSGGGIYIVPESLKEILPEIAASARQSLESAYQPFMDTLAKLPAANNG